MPNLWCRQEEVRDTGQLIERGVEKIRRRVGGIHGDDA